MGSGIIPLGFAVLCSDQSVRKSRKREMVYATSAGSMKYLCGTPDILSRVPLIGSTLGILSSHWTFLRIRIVQHVFTAMLDIYLNLPMLGKISGGLRISCRTILVYFMPTVSVKTRR